MMKEYRAKYQCAFCERPVRGGFDFCNKCNRENTAQFGPDWYTQQWAKCLIQEQRYLARLEEQNYEVLDADTRYARSAIIGIDHPSVYGYLTDQQAQDLLNNFYTLPDKRKNTTYDTTIRALMKQGFGARVIHRTLTTRFGDNAPSFSTVQRRIKEYRGV